MTTVASPRPHHSGCGPQNCGSQCSSGPVQDTQLHSQYRILRRTLRKTGQRDSETEYQDTQGSGEQGPMKWGCLLSLGKARLGRMFPCQETAVRLLCVGAENGTGEGVAGGRVLAHSSGSAARPLWGRGRPRRAARTLG